MTRTRKAAAVLIGAAAICATPIALGTTVANADPGIGIGAPGPGILPGPGPGLGGFGGPLSGLGLLPGAGFGLPGPGLI